MKSESRETMHVDNAILSPVANLNVHAVCMQSGMRLHASVIVYTYYMNTFPGRLSSACIASSITRDTKSDPCWGWLGLGPRLMA